MAFASKIYKRYLKSNGIRKKLWAFARQTMIKIKQDPACVMKIHDRRMKMPLSHMHPVYLRKDPLFNKLPHRIGAYVHQKRGRLVCIDVGANIGDTIAAFYQSDNDTFLAIEPNPKYHRYLVENWGWHQNVTALAEICSSGNGEGKFAIQERKGTASFIEDIHGTTMRYRSLDEIVKDYAFAASANVIKIDTDGHDFQVIEGAQGLLARQRPCVLFECDASENPHYAEDCVKILKLFQRNGYRNFLVYNNQGYLMGRYSLSDLAPFGNLLFFQLTSKCHHFDILVMKDEDFGGFYQAEIDFFTSLMTRKTLMNSAFAAATL